MDAHDDTRQRAIRTICALLSAAPRGAHYSLDGKGGRIVLLRRFDGGWSARVGDHVHMRDIETRIAAELVWDQSE